MAHHYTEAGLNQQAVIYWQEAGQIAMRRSAIVEALNHFNKGLDLLRELPDTPERAPQEVALQILLARSLIQNKGYGAAEVEQAFTRARRLIDQFGETSQFSEIMNGLYSYYLIRGEYQSGRIVAEQNLEAAKISQDPIRIQIANQSLGTVLLFMGKLRLAEEHMTQEIPRYNLEEDRSLAMIYGQAPSCNYNIWLGFTKWLLGYPDQASKLIQEGLRIAQEVAHPFTLVFALSSSSIFYCRTRAIQEATECLDTVLPLAEEQDFRMWAVHGSLVQGIVWTKSGRLLEGIEAITRGLDAYKNMGSEVSRANQLSFLAEAEGAAGRPDQGLATLEQALAHVKKSAEHFGEADIFRIKGDLLLLSGGTDDEVEDCYRQSMDISKHQNAKSWELRTAMSLARLWQRQGKQTEARVLLAEIYGWFTEGFDTPDLVDCRALLEQLS